MAARRILTAALLAGALALLCPRAEADLPGWAIDPVAPGIEHLRHERPGTLSVHAARVAPGAAAIRPVVAANAVGGFPGGPENGREYTSDLCRKAGGILCVNGDFFMCRTCGQSAGGLVVDGVPMRSFRPDLAQLSVADGQVTTDALGWSGRLTGKVQTTTYDFELASLNRDPIPDGITLYTSAWGPQTPPNVPRVELVFAAGGRLHAGTTPVAPVARREVAGPIPDDAVVLLATGSKAAVLNTIWHLWVHGQGRTRLLNLHSDLTFPATLSIGGHPVLLRDGERAVLNVHDPFVTQRHPRTLAGATAAGELLLVAVDGRQPGHSNGLTLYEAQDLLVELGAVEAINLDGGGSTTFVGRCGPDPCVRNRPSNGRERPVVSALALVAPVGVAKSGVAVAVAPAAVEPPPPAPVTTTTAPALPVLDIPTPTTTTMAPASTAEPTPTVELALAPMPQLDRIAPKSPTEDDIGRPARVAGAAIGLVAAGLLSRRSGRPASARRRS